jgi:integrase
MNKGENFNHPPKGSHITVDPIRSLRDVKKIKKLLADKPRDFALFTLGINTNLRASDLVALKVTDVADLVPGGELVLHEKKTGKRRRITINGAVYEALMNWLNLSPCCDRLFDDDDYPLFPGRNGPLTVPTVNNLVKSWCKAVGLKGNFGSHTLRKTFGYHQYFTFKTATPWLTITFNHSSERQTMAYLGIQPKEIQAIYMHEI